MWCVLTEHCSVSVNTSHSSGQPPGTHFMVLPWILNFEPSSKEQREGGDSVAWLPAWIWIITLSFYWGYLNFQWFEYNSLTESLTGYKLDPEDQRSSVSTKRSRDPDAQQQPQMMATLDRGAYLQMRWELPWTMKQRSYQTKYTSDQPAQNYFSPHAWEWQKKTNIVRLLNNWNKIFTVHNCTVKNRHWWAVI